MVPVRIRQDIVCSIPEIAYVYGQEVRRYLPAVPRSGDFVELAPGWSSAVVDYTTFCADPDEPADVKLRTIKTDNPETIEEHQQLVDEHGWRWNTPPPDPDYVASVRRRKER